MERTMSERHNTPIHTEYQHIFDVINNLLEEEDTKSLIIAIDGRCGSGKSTLGALLTEQFDCNIFHMDDFFLPFEMKTSKRLGEAGGNVHYERFEEEILRSLKQHKSVKYSQYLCNKGDFSQPTEVEPKKLNIVEGSYSLHPTLRNYYDYKIFIDIDSKAQQKRIFKRNGEQNLQDFLSKWIPM